MKNSDYVKINSANPLYLIIGEADSYTEEKMEINVQIWFLQIKTKKC